uniref:Uncharacterized protein n=1 Tax=Tetranychus urticae TaxID=32264 RepID=T1KVN1_TETUR
MVSLFRVGLTFKMVGFINLQLDITLYNSNEENPNLNLCERTTESLLVFLDEIYKNRVILSSM